MSTHHNSNINSSTRYNRLFCVPRPASVKKGLLTIKYNAPGVIETLVCAVAHVRMSRQHCVAVTQTPNEGSVMGRGFRGVDILFRAKINIGTTKVVALTYMVALS